MSSLDNLLTKIVQDSQDKADAIIENATEEAAKLVTARVAEAGRAKDVMLTEARREAEMRKELTLSAKRIEVRDDMLKTKQGLIEQAFVRAVEKLNSLSLDEYQRFLNKYLLQLELAGDEEVFVPEAYAKVSLAEVNGKLGGKLTLGATYVKSGFLVAKDGVENNNTYEALLDFYRDDLEKLVAEKLF